MSCICGNNLAILHSVFCSSLLDLVLQVEGAVTNGCRLCVAQCALSSEEREKLATGNNEDELPMDNEERYFKLSVTFTQRSCMTFAVRTSKIRDCLLISSAVFLKLPAHKFAVSYSDAARTAASTTTTAILVVLISKIKVYKNEF